MMSFYGTHAGKDSVNSLTHCGNNVRLFLLEFLQNGGNAPNSVRRKLLFEAISKAGQTFTSNSNHHNVGIFGYDLASSKKYIQIGTFPKERERES